VKDSKDLPQKRREVLAKEIEKLAEDIVIIKLSPCKIDNFRKGGINLNRLEEMKFIDIINLMNPHKTYVDSPDVKPERLKALLVKETGNKGMFVEHKADVKYPIVSAASIIAKVMREEEVKELHKKYGDFGPGYPSNDKTINWMNDWMKKNKEFPDIVRKTWDTSITIKNNHHQQRLGSFFQKLRKKEECKGKK
jgi:ribonuclease HII